MVLYDMYYYGKLNNTRTTYCARYSSQASAVNQAKKVGNIGTEDTRSAACPHPFNFRQQGVEGQSTKRYVPTY